MASINLNIPPDLSSRVVSGYAYSNGYGQFITGNGLIDENAPTMGQFAKSSLVQHIKQNVIKNEFREARSAIQQTLSSLTGNW
jgi:hypothetical protein